MVFSCFKGWYWKMVTKFHTKVKQHWHGWNFFHAKWFVLKMVCMHWKWFASKMIFIQNGFHSKWFSFKMVCIQNVLHSKCFAFKMFCIQNVYAYKMFMHSKCLHSKCFAFKMFCIQNVCGQILAFKMLHSKNFLWDYMESLIQCCWSEVINFSCLDILPGQRSGVFTSFTLNLEVDLKAAGLHVDFSKNFFSYHGIFQYGL